MLKIKSIFAIFSLAILVGCAQQPKYYTTIPVATRDKLINDMQNWQVSGKIGIRQRDSGHNISFEWRQRVNKYYLYLFSPLATDSAKINGSPGKVSLVASDRQTYTATTAEELVKEHLGWDLPVDNLAYWIRGVPAPNVNPMVAHYDRYNQLQSLQQGGWVIEYQGYFPTAPVSMPEKIVISNGKIVLKIVIRQWKK